MPPKRQMAGPPDTSPSSRRRQSRRLAAAAREPKASEPESNASSQPAVMTHRRSARRRPKASRPKAEQGLTNDESQDNITISDIIPLAEEDGITRAPCKAYYKKQIEQSTYSDRSKDNKHSSAKVSKSLKINYLIN